MFKWVVVVKGRLIILCAEGRGRCATLLCAEGRGRCATCLCRGRARVAPYPPSQRQAPRPPSAELIQSREAIPVASVEA